MRNYFSGWYFKCQSKNQTLAIIPAVHETNGNKTYSVQVITEDAASDISNTQVKGKIKLTNLKPIKYDIMGPFAFVPFMECRHSVYNMMHQVDGLIRINEKAYVFDKALGYWEGDRGRSFPKEYAWTQSFILDDKGEAAGSIMLSVADIPLAGTHFTGIIGIVLWKGREYRFATYLGARAVLKKDNMLLIRQGNMELEARLREQHAHPLWAPQNGAMVRTIHENLVCKAFYRFRKNGVTQFAFETDKASFEYEYEWRKLC